jgi:hypothetical protein
MTRLVPFQSLTYSGSQASIRLTSANSAKTSSQKLQGFGVNQRLFQIFPALSLSDRFPWLFSSLRQWKK